VVNPDIWVVVAKFFMNFVIINVLYYCVKPAENSCVDFIFNLKIECFVKSS